MFTTVIIYLLIGCCLAIVVYLFIAKKSQHKFKQIATILHEFISATQVLYTKGTYNTPFDAHLDQLYNEVKPHAVLAQRYPSNFFVTDEEKQLCKTFLTRLEDYPTAKEYQITIFDAFQYVSSHMEEARQTFNHFVADDHFLAHSELEHYRSTYKDLYYKASLLYQDAFPEQLTEEEQNTKTLLHHFILRYDDLEGIAKRHNATFESKQLAQHKEFFDTVLAYPLDPQQKHAILTLEDNTLVVSAAGSGKTSTMVAKIKYLINCQHYDPAKILVLTYTRKAAEELTERLGYGSQLCCSTFHSLALKIIGEANNFRPVIADEKTTQLIYQQLRKTAAFTHAIINYNAAFMQGVQCEYDYNIENEDDYKAMQDELRKQQYVPDRTGRYPAIKSMQEFEICKYLFDNGIEYEYECKYEYETADEQHREYLPDFSIFYEVDGVKKRIYLEHFGIDREGNVAKFFGGNTQNYAAANKNYNEGILWKREIHKQYGTVLIETTSAMFQNNTWKSILETQLKANGVPFHPRPIEEISAKTADELEQQDEAFIKLTEAFIALMKSNLYTIDQVEERLHRQVFTRNTYKTLALFDNIVSPVVKEYTQQLTQSSQIDFIDAILMATELIKQGKYQHQYDYILVDEFQDISKARYQLIQALRSDFPRTKLFCVGDDWQSIYRFAGSQLDLFTRFSDYFGYTNECYIEQTYRYNEPVLSLASRFVLQNPHQKRKKVRNPLGTTAAPTNIHLYPFATPQQQADEIIRIVQSYPKEDKICILGRYTYSWMFLQRMQTNGLIACRIEDRHTGKVIITVDGHPCRYLTAHSSKGLEADHVIVINCNAGEQGFPSEIVDSSLLQYVLNDSDNYPYAEERRLWYVTITRAKKNLHILYNRSTPSAFVTELNELMHPKPKSKPKPTSTAQTQQTSFTFKQAQDPNAPKVIALVGASQIVKVERFKKGSVRYTIRLKTGTIIKVWGAQSLKDAAQYQIIALNNDGKENWVLCNVHTR